MGGWCADAGGCEAGGSELSAAHGSFPRQFPASGTCAFWERGFAGQFGKLEVVELKWHVGGCVDAQLCSGVDESAVGACAQLVFAPVDVVLSEDIPLLPSGFCVSPIDTSVAVRWLCVGEGSRG